MSTIIAHIALDGASRNTDYQTSSFDARLACGQSWEHSLVEHLKTQGLDKVYQLDQYIPFKSAFYSKNPAPARWRSMEQSKLPQGLFAKFQRDIRVIHNGKGYNLEVKTKAGIFNNPNILVGGIASRWDKYRFPVHYIVAIDRTTGEARVTEADRLTRETSWLTIKSQELSYGVPRHLFRPLDSWLDFIRA